MALLEVRNVHSGYGKLEILRDITLDVNEGEIVSILGANGAGKTTLLRTISGVLPTWQGTIAFDGQNLKGMRPDKRAQLGLAHQPEGRGIFQTLTVRENMELSLVARRGDKSTIATDREQLLEAFPPLREKIDQKASALSGGQQQMLAVARSMMARPKLLMIDEISFGLAPILVDELFNMIERLNMSGTTFLLVEQHAGVLEISHRTYVIRVGRNEISGPSDEIAKSTNLARAYLGA
jgi:branched-chain amino acid transport system ATP-binding protein